MHVHKNQVSSRETHDSLVKAEKMPMVFLEITKTHILVLSLWTTSMIVWDITRHRGGTLFDATNQVEMYSSSLTCVEALCRSRDDAGVKYIILTLGCQGIWFMDDGSNDIMCGLCRCSKNFTYNVFSSGNITLAVNNCSTSPTSKNHRPLLSP